MEVKIAPGMITDLYITPDTSKQTASNKKEIIKNKNNLFSGLFNKKEK